MFRYDLRRSLENNIKRYLVEFREANSQAYRVKMFTLYTDICTTASDEVPAAAFNQIISDLKRVGILKTAHDSQEVYLSDAAWGLHIASKAVRA
jgi:hypothetical protein